MANIRITFKDDTWEEFRHEGRAGGSWTKSVKYEAGWVIVEDEWGKRTAFPQDAVKKVEEEPHRGRW